MTISMCEPMATRIIKAVEPAELSELVRGEDVRLLERVAPLVRDHNVTLDLASVERIDAAGITALVALYRDAQESGHCFTVTNATERVAQILAVVGLDRFLFSHNAVHRSNCGSQMQRPAA